MTDMKKVAIYGAGGFAREVAWLLSTLEGSEVFDVLGYVEDGTDRDRVVNGKPVMSWETFSGSHRDSLVAVAIGSPQSRSQLVAKCAEAGFSFATLVHPAVKMSEFVELGVGSIVCCGAILTVNIKIEQHVHINLACTIGHDVSIGEFSTLAPGVHVSGNVHIGKSVYLGTGASIINGKFDNPIIIGDGGVIGAGACITRSTEPDCLYAGVPAELKKRYALRNG